MAGAPNVIGGYKISYAEGTITNAKPASASWKQILGSVNKLPNFFPPAEKQEYRVLDSKQASAIAGARSSIDGTLSIYLNNEFYDAHAEMVASQLDDAKGNCFWFKVEYVDDKRTVYCRCQIDDHIPTPTDESGGLFLYELTLSNIDEPIDEWNAVIEP